MRSFLRCYGARQPGKRANPSSERDETFGDNNSMIEHANNPVALTNSLVLFFFFSECPVMLNINQSE